MATNPFFRSNYNARRKDQKLIDSLTIESIKNTGIDVKYIPRNFVNEDRLYGEDISSAFDKSYLIECYMNPMDSWGGDQEFLGKFGIEIQDEVTIFISISRFAEEITGDNEDITRPREGDLIALPPEIDKRERMFEISYVPPEAIFYQFGSLYSYEIRMRVFEYGSETFEGNDQTWNILDDEYAGETTVVVDGEEQFELGETITSLDDTDSLFAYIGSWNPEKRALGLFHIQDIEKLREGTTIVSESGATATIESVDSRFANDESASNEFFDEESPIQNFNRQNPFGDE